MSILEIAIGVGVLAFVSFVFGVWVAWEAQHAMVKHDKRTRWQAASSDERGHAETRQFSRDEIASQFSVEVDKTNAIG